MRTLQNAIDAYMNSVVHKIHTLPTNNIILVLRENLFFRKTFVRLFSTQKILAVLGGPANQVNLYPSLSTTNNIETNKNIQRVCI